jgi:hypothetical protein
LTALFGIPRIDIHRRPTVIRTFGCASSGRDRKGIQIESFEIVKTNNLQPPVGLRYCFRTEHKAACQNRCARRDQGFLEAFLYKFGVSRKKPAKWIANQHPQILKMLQVVMNPESKTLNVAANDTPQKERQHDANIKKTLIQKRDS